MSRKQNPRPPDFLTTKGTWHHNHHTPIFDEMIDSPAWMVLSDGAKNVYLLIAREYKGAYTGNTVICPYSTMTAHRIRKQSIPKWLRELQALGFIRIESNGGLYKIPNEYRLISDWSKYKTIESALTAKMSVHNDSG